MDEHSSDGIYQLGQSGNSEIEIRFDENFRQWVRKSSLGNSARLFLQYEKQKQAWACGHMKPIQVPEIVSEWDGKGFGMTYLRGLPLGFFLGTASRKQVSQVSNDLVGYFNHLDVVESESPIAFAPSMETKLKNIKDSMSSSNLDWAQTLLAWVSEIFKSSFAPAGWNHGDFSFENLLVQHRTLRIWAIDFLDSPLETPLIDLGRLRLDADFGWWKFHSNRSATRALNERQIEISLRKTELSLKTPPEVLDAFIGFAILRIAPYTISPVRMGFLRYAASELMRRNHL